MTQYTASRLEVATGMEDNEASRGHVGRRKNNEGSKEEGMPFGQGIKEVFLEEVDLEGWVGSEHAEKDRQGRALYAEETV